jgi:hypothetical protein
MRIWALVAAAGVLPACLTIPAFTPPTYDDDECAPGVSIGELPDASHTVNGPSYSIHFPIAGYHYPDHVVLGQNDVLAGGQVPTCSDQILTGVGLAPSDRIDGTAVAPSSPGTVTVIADGPAVAKLDVAWTSAMTCTPAASISGHTSFTMMPDGRVVRFDAIDSPTAQADVANCTCSGGATLAAWDVSSYFVAVQSQFSAIVNSALSPVTPSDTAAQDQILCTSGPDHAVAFGFPLDQVRVKTVNTGHAFTFDFLGTPTTVLDTTTTFPGTTSAYLFGAGNACPALIGTLQAFGADPKLAVNGVQLSTNTDGIYGGDDGGGHVGVSVGATTTLTAPTLPIPAGFVVWLDLGVTRSSFQITGTNEVGTSWYTLGRPKQNGDSQVIIWFENQLAVGDSITIVAGND